MIQSHIMIDQEHTLQWNERGRLWRTLVPGSSITDLLKNSQRQYRHLRSVGQKEDYKN